MAISIKDLVKDLSKEDILEALLAIAKAANLPVTAWQTGEPIGGLLVILSEQFAKLWNDPIAKALRAPFLEFSEGVWLTVVAWVFYDVTRRGQTFAGSPITIENRAGGVYTFVPGELRVPNAKGKTFTNVTGGFMPHYNGIGAFPTLTLDFVADEAGSGSNTPGGGIRAYPTTPVTAPAGIYVKTNIDPLFADDAESDASLKERCRLSTGPLSSGGPKATFEALARGAKRADGTSVDVTRVRVIETPNEDVEVHVYLAGASGATTGNSMTADTDVYLVNERIQALANAVGITASVDAATERLVSVMVDMRVDRASNVTKAEAEAAGTDAIAAYFRELPIGGHKTGSGEPGRVIVSEYAAKASESIGGIIKASELNGDVELEPYEVAVPNIYVAAVLVSQ